MASSYIEYIDQNQFEEKVKKNKRPVVLDFYSTECPPCEALAAKFEPLSEIYGKDIQFLKIFRQENRSLAEELGVFGSPTLLFYKDGQEMAERMTGAIKKSDLVQSLNSLISKERVNEIESKKVMKQTDCDVLILGAGPAGLTAAIYAASAKLKTIVVDPDLAGGQVKITHLVSNYPGFENPIPGMELMYYMENQSVNQNAIHKFSVDITSVDLKNKKVVIDSDETITAKAIIVATGARPRSLNLPGEKEYMGKGLSYCATCDGKYYEEKDILVIGGGNSAIEESLFLTKFANSIRIVHQFDNLQANKMAQEKALNHPKISFIWNTEPREFIASNGNKVNRVKVENLKTQEYYDLETDGVFIFVGYTPNLEGIGHQLDLNEWGYVNVNEDMETNIPGVYAAGDVISKKIRQITGAVNDGTIAAVNCEKYIESLKSIPTT